MDQLVKTTSNAGMSEDQGQKAAGGLFSLKKKNEEDCRESSWFGSTCESNKKVLPSVKAAAEEENLMGSVMGCLGGSMGGRLCSMRKEFE